MRIGVIADDLTGAQEMGVLLVGRGVRTIVTFDQDVLGTDAEALVVDTESRHLPATEAAARVRTAMAQLRALGATQLFKKVDSTLRGNVEAEMEAFAPDVVFTPAYPSMKRVVRGGVLYVDDTPIGQTVFANDVRTPSGIAVQMRDAATDQDLQALVSRNAGAALAGSGGLGRAWVESLAPGSFTPATPAVPRKPLVVCGSRHPASRAQAIAAQSSGVSVLMSPDAAGDPAHEARALAQSARGIDADLLILFGGDTAYAVLQARGLFHLDPIRELMPGIALSVAREMMIVTKAGGFGHEQVVADILRQLT